jgi:hypothetical protein
MIFKAGSEFKITRDLGIEDKNKQLLLHCTISLFNEKVGKFFGRTAYLPLIPLVFLTQDRLCIGVKHGHEVVQAFLLAETTSIKAFEYLAAVDLHIYDPTECPGPSAYTHLGYFTTKLDNLKKTYIQAVKETKTTPNDTISVNLIQGTPRDLLIRRNETLKTVGDFIEF